MGGALYWKDLISVVKELGFSTPYLVTASKILVHNSEILKKTGMFMSDSTACFNMSCSSSLGVIQAAIPQIPCRFILSDHPDRELSDFIGPQMIPNFWMFVLLFIVFIVMAIDSIAMIVATLSTFSKAVCLSVSALENNAGLKLTFNSLVKQKPGLFGVEDQCRIQYE